ncbi:hypothetical protein ACOME3_004336 [Neoechinorhynchus agilis]
MPLFRRSKRSSLTPTADDRSASTSRAEEDKTRITMNDILSLPFKCVSLRIDEFDSTDVGSSIADHRVFYEIRGYENVLRRMERSAQLFKLLENMFEDRRRLEERHANDLIAFATRWHRALDASSEYGTNKRAWRVAVDCAQVDATILQTGAGRLRALVKRVNESRKQYAARPVGDSSSRRKCEMHGEYKKRFEATQRQWAKFLMRADEGRNEYERYVGMYRHAKRISEATESDFGASEIQKTSSSQATATNKKQMEFSKERYIRCIQEMEKSKIVYVHEMDHLFKECQQIEGERMDFFKDMYKKFSDLRQSTLSDAAKCINKKLDLAIAEQNTKADLEWYSDNFGPGTVANYVWPKFDVVDHS